MLAIRDYGDGRVIEALEVPPDFAMEHLHFSTSTVTQPTRWATDEEPLDKG